MAIRIFLGDGNKLISKAGCYCKWCWGIVIILKKLTKKPQPILLAEIGGLLNCSKQGERKTGSISGDQGNTMSQVLGFGSLEWLEASWPRNADLPHTFIPLVFLGSIPYSLFACKVY